MAVPQPNNDLARPFEVESLYNDGFIDETTKDNVIADLQGEMTTAGRIYLCPKCGGAGFHSALVDNPGGDDYKIRCTMGVFKPIYTADPTIQCLGWGYLTVQLKYVVTEEVEAV